MTRPLVVALSGALLLAGCGGAAEDAGEATDDAMAGFGVPRQTTIDEVTAERLPLSGTIEIAGDGCLYLAMDGGARPWIVWPPGAAQGADGGVVTASGEALGDGDAVLGVGAVVTLADLPDGADPDSYFGAFGGFCDADAAGVVVLDQVSRAGG
mgnify:CR=1 FL=1